MTMAFSSTGSNIGSISFSTFSMTKHLGSSFLLNGINPQPCFLNIILTLQALDVYEFKPTSKKWTLTDFDQQKWEWKNHALRAFYGYTGAQWVFTCFHSKILVDRRISATVYHQRAEHRKLLSNKHGHKIMGWIAFFSWRLGSPAPALSKKMC